MSCFAVDLHIHSALSPCADDEMTPNNIVNMSVLKELDIIAVTDHNTVANCEAVMKCARDKKLIVVPGMELETREEIHVVCLFPDIAKAWEMQEVVNSRHNGLQNREDIFGRQILFDEQDNIIGYEKRLLITAVDIGIDEAFRLVRGIGGAVIPAHADRDSYSILTNLGAVPEELGVRYLELSSGCDTDLLLKKYPGLNAFKHIRSSDAHRLEDISEREFFMELREATAHCLIDTLECC